jgi:hypothetical protein
MERPQHISQDNSFCRAQLLPRPRQFGRGDPEAQNRRDFGTRKLKLCRDRRSPFTNTSDISGQAGTLARVSSIAPSRDVIKHSYAIDIRQRLYESVRCFARRSW